MRTIKLEITLPQGDQMLREQRGSYLTNRYGARQHVQPWPAGAYGWCCVMLPGWLCRGHVGWGWLGASQLHE